MLLLSEFQTSYDPICTLQDPGKTLTLRIVGSKRKVITNTRQIEEPLNMKVRSDSPPIFPHWAAIELCLVKKDYAEHSSDIQKRKTRGFN